MPTIRLLLTLALTATFVTAQDSPYLARAKYKNASGAEVASIKFYTKKAKIELPSRTLESKQSSGTKNKYADLKTGAVAYEIKRSGPDKFKLRKPDGSLLWKVKSGPEGITVSDNEEGDNAFLLTAKALSDNSKPAGTANRSSSDPKKLKLAGAEGDAHSVAWSYSPPPSQLLLWLADRIPADQRAILITELVRPKLESE